VRVCVHFGSLSYLDSSKKKYFFISQFLIPLFLSKYFFCFIYLFTNKLTHKQYVHIHKSRCNLIFFSLPMYMRLTTIFLSPVLLCWFFSLLTGVASWILLLFKSKNIFQFSSQTINFVCERLKFCFVNFMTNLRMFLLGI
jgi:hypothetical protein